MLRVTTPTDREMTRVFDAPRKMVFDALTKPELLRRWFSGPPGWMLAACEFDFRVGGVMKTPMAEGVSAGYDNLAELLATLTAEEQQ